MDRETFWLVWSPTGTHPPSKRHATRDLAVAEAERLAECAPSAEFYVLCAVSRSSARRVTTITLTDDIPF
jgi:hypothetical protein